jgi:hypothetical protein
VQNDPAVHTRAFLGQAERSRTKGWRLDRSALPITTARLAPSATWQLKLPRPVQRSRELQRLTEMDSPLSPLECFASTIGRGYQLGWLKDVWQWCEGWVTDQLAHTWVSGVGVPVVLIVIGAAWKAMARPGGPTPYSILLKWPELPTSDRAFGFDLMLAGLGAQLGFLALRIGQGSTARQLDFRGLWLTLVLTILLIPFIRIFGYERRGRKQVLRQDLGVALPNLVGIVVLIYVYNANT